MAARINPLKGAPFAPFARGLSAGDILISTR